MNTSRRHIPGDKEDGSSSFVHFAITTSGKLGEIHPLFIIPFWVCFTWLTYRIWHKQGVYILSIATLFFTGDWINFALLPLKHRSWGPVTPPLLALSILRFIIRVIIGITNSSSLRFFWALLADTFLSIVVYYATWIEPFTIKLTRINLHVPATFLHQQICLAHISDIHYEGTSSRETELLNILTEESPHVIVITGDYLNLSSVYDSRAQMEVRELLSNIHAPLGVFAITGSPAVDHPTVIPRIFADLNIQWLMDSSQKLSLPGTKIYITGIVNTYNHQRDINAMRKTLEKLPSDCFSIMLYHTPDLFPHTEEMNVNVYLCGHTHGGQISLPLYGALVTSSIYGKKYERGLYHTADAVGYVNRGLGMEGMGAPRARLFAPPEVVIWTLIPEKNDFD